MKPDHSPLEGMLRDSLGRQADRGTGTGPGLDGVLGRARTIRRHRRQGAAVAAAAAVVAIAVPSAILLNNSPNASAPVPTHEGTPTMAPSPSTAKMSPDKSPSKPSPTHKASKASPTKTASAPSKATEYESLPAIPQGPAPSVGYVDLDGVVHGPGPGGQIPGNTSNITAFHDFRGGWVVGRDLKLTRYDQHGKVVGTGDNSGIKVSDDHVNVAWKSGRTVFYGPDNTMGEGGPAKAQAPAGTNLIGFLPYGPALSADGNTVYTMNNAGKFVKQTIGLYPAATSQTANLVAGTTGSVAKSDFKGAVYDMAARKLLWTSKWRPVSFSPDGKYAAAFPAYDNGDPEAFAILDARTGTVLAQTPKLKGIYFGWTVAWQDDDTLVMTATTSNGRASSMLTLRTDGSFARGGDIVNHAAGADPFLFVAQS